MRGLSKAGLKACAAAVALATASLGPAASAQMVEGVAAVVNDDIITTYDVRQRGLLLLASNGIEATAENQGRARQQALRDLVDERLQLQEARRYELEVSPETVDRQIADIARANDLTADQFVSQLGSVGIGVATLRRQIEADVAWRRLINGRYGRLVTISDQAIRETQERISSNATRTQYHAAEIFLPAITQADFAEAEAAATRLLQEMQRGAPFPLVARQFSAAASAAAGGDLGWVASGELRPEMQATLDRLQPGQVSTPFRTEDGVYIVALREKREGAAAQRTERVTLRQVTAPSGSASALDRARRRIESCTTLEATMRDVQGAEVIDLGTAAVSELSETVQTQISGLTDGQSSAPAASGESVSMMVVCGRETNTTGVPNRAEIENRLFEQELAMHAQRYLRDLRRDATIITR
ncbi:MAG: peptidylprolyl isomerase [Alphaproteobacteria bacterium]|nr:peptidylprolyl isomerase [Alphaproteobacteria bacterium]